MVWIKWIKEIKWITEIKGSERLKDQRDQRDQMDQRARIDQADQQLSLQHSSVTQSYVHVYPDRSWHYKLLGHRIIVRQTNCQLTNADLPKARLRERIRMFWGTECWRSSSPFFFSVGRAIKSNYWICISLARHLVKLWASFLLKVGWLSQGVVEEIGPIWREELVAGRCYN